MSHSHNHRPDDEPRHATNRRGHPRHDAYRHGGHAVDFDEDFDEDLQARDGFGPSSGDEAYEPPAQRANSSS
ncbi:MAG TPA: hypothetical protein VGM81_18490 [Burkholderiaceae bacterium]|jgi:hypothetical protein